MKAHPVVSERSLAPTYPGDMGTSCPICAGSLEMIDIAPCFDCGHSPSELGELVRGEHEYHVFEIWGHEIVLCDFCDADFGSYYPEYWGLPRGPFPDYLLALVRKVGNPEVGRDWFCPACKHRLAFLRFRSLAMAHNAA